MNHLNQNGGANQARIVGLLHNRSDHTPPAGLSIAVRIGSNGQSVQTIATGFSHLDGGFIVPLTEDAKANLTHSDSVILEIQDQFGRAVESYGPISGLEALRELIIDVVPRPSEERPAAPPFRDPFVAHSETYPREIEALHRADIRNWEQFARADLEVLSHRLDFPAYRLEAVRLQGEMNADPAIFSPDAARLLVEVGIKTRRDLAFAEPINLNRKIRQAVRDDKIDATGFDPSAVHGWIASARRWALGTLTTSYTAEQIANVRRGL